MSGDILLNKLNLGERERQTSKKLFSPDFSDGDAI